MSVRSYLSIGDVLTLLRQEFPDVTISKIRFLESQGLVNPERTPSGYRKFYEHDVERLRWVLRQQRENFLPLKVIKDRLDDEQSAGSADVDGDSAVAAGEAPAAAEPVLVGQRSASDRPGPAAAGSLGASASGGVRNAGTGTSAGSHPDGPTLPGIEPAPADAGRTSAPVPPSVTRSATSSSTAKAAASGANRVTATPAPSAAPASSERHGAAGAGPAPAGIPSAGAGRRARTRAPGGPGGPPDVTPTAVGNGATEARPETGAARVQESSSAPAKPPAHTGTPAPGHRTPSAAPLAPVVGAHLSGASLSIDELASASGLDISFLEELVAYGLMVETRVAGLPCFDEEALAVATLAAGFAQFGIEPRHLRLYKNAADREAGFVEQIVLPLVRQRNPEARARANETADELARLGQQLRASLLRSALGDLLNG